jgi:hypothetical protein
MRQVISGAFMLPIFLLLLGCGGGSSGAGVEPLVLGTATTERGNTTFRQTVAMEDTDTYEYFPGQANVWDLNGDLSISDGGDDQFDGAMSLYVDGASFDYLNYEDLTFYSPAMGSAQGVLVAAVVEGVEKNYSNSGPFPALGGTYSAYLNDISDGRLYQAVDLSNAHGDITLSWSWNVNVAEGQIEGFSPFLRVVVRSNAGEELDELFLIRRDENDSHSVTLNDYADENVIISFEIRSSGYGPNLIDDISITDGNNTQFIVNGDFETGDLTGWSTNSPAEFQNITTVEVPLSSLTVTRSFYTVPNKLWGRWVDVFKNETDAPVTATISYSSDLGSDDYGILYLTPGTDGHALTCWDGRAYASPTPTSSENDRDVAFVFGAVADVNFTTATAIGTSDGSDEIDHHYELTLEPGATAAIVNFIIMGGMDTGETAEDATALATVVDAAAVDIVTNFWNDNQYRSGMTQEQIDAIVNF